MGMPKYIINFDELAKLLGDGINLNIKGTTNDLEKLLTDYFDKLLDILKQFLKLKYAQYSIGLHSYIPALQFDFELEHSFDEDVTITGITYSQTGWKVMDCWDLYIDGKLLFNGIFTKELGEHKSFNAFYPVKANKVIKIVHHNNSGNSKQLWFDIDYFKGAIELPPIPDPPNPPNPPEIPPQPGVPEITHNYDWKLIMRWENNVGADLDLYLNLDNNIKVYFGNREYVKDENSRVWLDRDVVGHHGENTRLEGPEIITILGKPFNTAKVLITHFNYKLGSTSTNVALKEDVTLEVYKINEDKTETLINQFSISGSEFSKDNYEIFICNIDLINNTIN